jgi:Predicted nucleic acid-binding protein, contains PIN domain
MNDEPFFIDTNIVMYAAGKEHPYKGACATIISGIADGSFSRDIGIPLTDTETFQEILYRYALVGRWESGILICKHFLALRLDILPVDSSEVERMIALAQIYKGKGIPPRDLIHAAIMMNHGIKKIISVDSHFDLISEVTRIDPKLISKPAH